MKLPERLFSRMFLAYLPFALYPYGPAKAGLAASWTVLFLWVTVLFFWITRRLFPGRSLKAMFFLWLWVWAQAAWTLTKLPPFWVLSVFFLMPVSFLDDAVRPEHVRIFSKKIPRYFFERAVSGLGFAVFVLVMTLLRELGRTRLAIHIFEHPAGLFLAAAFFAFLWKNQIFRKGG